MCFKEIICIIIVNLNDFLALFTIIDYYALDF